MCKLPKEITVTDISYILDNPWGISGKEWHLEGKNGKQAAHALIVKRLNTTSKDGYSKIWRTPNKEPIAILGMYKFKNKIYETFFVASAHMEAQALKLSFDMRTILKQQAALYTGCTCAIYSESNHPSQMSWFRFLGFTYVPEGNLGNTNYFEYKAPAK